MRASGSELASVPRGRPVFLRLLGASLRLAGAVAPGPTAEIVRRALFTPQRRRQRPKERETLQRATSARHRVGDEEVCHYEWGNGKRHVLLVHGWSGHAGQMTSFVDSLVGAGYHVIGLDLPGHGKSSGKRASVVHFSNAIKHAQEIYGPFQGVIAHSLGAASIALALSGGLRCERVVFVAPVSNFDFVWERSRKMFGISRKAMDRTVVRAEKWLDVRFDAISPEQLAQGFTEELLIVHDGSDEEVPLEGSRALAFRWPKAEIVVTEKLGHIRVLHDQNVVERSVRFLGGSKTQGPRSAKSV